MKIVSPFLKKILYPSMSVAGIFHRTSATGLAVVTYHGVLPEGYEPVDVVFDGNLVSAETLRRQLRLLKEHYNVITPGDALAWLQGSLNLPPRAVLLTCDDGLLNCLTDMLPVLQTEDVTCLFFVTGASASESRTMLWYEDLFLLFLRAPAGRFEIASEEAIIRGDLASREDRRTMWWSSVKQLSRTSEETRKSFLRVARERFQLPGSPDFTRSEALCRRFGLMIADELRELASAGMTIGAHTLSHPILAQMPPEVAYAEMSESKAGLERTLQSQVWALAYPFGDKASITPQILTMAQEAGFAAAFTNFGGGLSTDLSKYALPRVHVTADMNLAEFEAHVSGFYERMQRSVGRNWHRVGMALT